MMEWTKKRRGRALLVASALLALVITFAGGGMLLVYLGIFITGLLIGRAYMRFRQLYMDYKLGLRVNSIIYSSKQVEEIQKENDKLKGELANLSQRMQVYQAGAVPRATSFSLPNDDERRYM